jgi:hypothetical protein
VDLPSSRPTAAKDSPARFSVARIPTMTSARGNALRLSSLRTPKRGTAGEVFGFIDLPAGETLVQNALRVVVGRARDGRSLVGV